MNGEYDDYDFDELYDEGPSDDGYDPDVKRSSEFGPAELDGEHASPDTDADAPDGEIDASQHMMLSYLNANQKLWVRCAPILDEAYFSAELKPVLKLMMEFEGQNRLMPSQSIVKADTGITLDDVSDDAKEPMVEEFIATRVEEFCRHQATNEFLWEASEIVEADRTKATMAGLVKEMERISSITVKQDLGVEFHRDAKEQLEIADQAGALPTDFEFLDDSLNGGVSCPSYNLVSAASGQGKSIYLQNQSINYILQGHNVVYITLELPEFMIVRRLAAMKTSVGINDIQANIDTVLNKIKRDAKKEGKLQIKRMPMSGVSIADIKAYVAELRAETGLEWDHIMIDYMDLMSPMLAGIRADNLHMKDQQVAVELYDWAHEPGRNKTIWSASQQTKGAKDEKDARQSAVAGGVGKVNTADNLLVLKRTLEDIQNQMCWCFVEKGRNGGQGRKIPFGWHSQTQRLSNTEDMYELYQEANIPGGGTDDDKSDGKKPGRFANDPMVRTKQEMDEKSTPKQRQISDTIQRRMQRGKKQ